MKNDVKSFPIIPMILQLWRLNQADYFFDYS